MRENGTFYEIKLFFINSVSEEEAEKKNCDSPAAFSKET